MDRKDWKMFGFGMACFIVAMIAQACGVARGGGFVTAEEISGPNGLRCFAIMQDGNAVGGNCK